MSSNLDTWLASGKRQRLRSGDEVFVAERGSGPPVLLLHGFPTWSLDWQPVVERLAPELRCIAPDFLGYGFSDKPKRDYRIDEQADLIEAIAASRGLTSVAIAAHDFGAIVAQELLRRTQCGTSALEISSLTILNSGIVYAQYRPTRLQQLLAKPVLGALLSRMTGKQRAFKALAAVFGTRAPLTEAEFEPLWRGITERDGHRLAHRLIAYNAERAARHPAWETALGEATMPLALVWGLADPVSGARVVAAARERYPSATIVEIPEAGHYPQLEDPQTVAAAIAANSRRGTHTSSG